MSPLYVYILHVIQCMVSLPSRYMSGVGTKWYNERLGDDTPWELSDISGNASYNKHQEYGWFIGWKSQPCSR